MTIYINFIVIVLAFAVTRGDKVCEKEEFESFYEKLVEILVKRERVGAQSTLREFKEDRKNVYECGEFLLSKLKEYDAKNETALTKEEKTSIRDEYSLLVSWIVACDTVELWAGEKKGGTIASAIYHFLGGNPADVIGPRDEEDKLTHITYPK
ncbi:uncharacterized protein LOC135846019 [Planococcus citri]|uniref:uncharacterized protein LOC135846019 n=1 Tax=Planococcus citri TaxID=170843 RepID=UPI0031F9C55B